MKASSSLGGVEGLAVCAAAGLVRTPAKHASRRAKPARVKVWCTKASEDERRAGWPCAVDDDRCRGVPRGRLKRIVFCGVLPTTPLMPSRPRPRVDVPQAGRLFLPLLIVLFVGSGCAALIYEVVWLQLLQLVIGSSAVSIGVLLGTFMGGMCLGSLLLPRYVSPDVHPLRVYAWLELGIGAIGVAVLVFVPIVGSLYATSVAHGFPGILLRGLLCAICLLPPTVLMGATLPAIARWIGTTGTGVSWLGFFYGANIAGAVFGSLLAGFYLLRTYDMATATFVAAAVNVLVGVIGLRLAATTPYRAPASADPAGTVSPARGAASVYVAIALSGFCALGAEVVWTRGLSLLLGATTYTFSIILAVFLTGLGIGSSVGSFLSRPIATPRTALAWCQVLAGLAAAWAAVMLGRSLPYWPVNPWLSTSPWLTFQIDLVRCFWTLLPASLMWGASFRWRPTCRLAGRSVQIGRSTIDSETSATGWWGAAA